ncbi:CAP domain-containing protein [Nocardioides sp. URHA0020]|uniref:CAP domain-containing protein n=1 Tax=Nocardioides sp. URHA0020 TaxID=1380392 RepID=UPI0006883275|nr:CAP domain-containing protein [Nocardioides sp. URHA0020]
MFSALRSTTLLLAAAVLAVSPWLVPVQAVAAKASPAATYSHAAFKATNVQRVKHDRVRLKKSACLTTMAKRWARHMARTGKLEHQSLGAIAKRCHTSWTGENIAAGYRSGRAVVNTGWMHSPGHRQNILRPQYRLMGIGAYRDRDGFWWVSQVFGRR